MMVDCMDLEEMEKFQKFLDGRIASTRKSMDPKSEEPAPWFFACFDISNI